MLNYNNVRQTSGVTEKFFFSYFCSIKIAAYDSGSYKKTDRCLTAKLMISRNSWLQDMSRTKPQTFFFVCLFF